MTFSELYDRMITRPELKWWRQQNKRRVHARRFMRDNSNHDNNRRWPPRSTGGKALMNHYRLMLDERRG
ncbi:hypothetical protein BST61_g3059 [Cercospora zeina]